MTLRHLAILTTVVLGQMTPVFAADAVEVVDGALADDEAVQPVSTEVADLQTPLEDALTNADRTYKPPLRSIQNYPRTVFGCRGRRSQSS